MYEGCVDTKRKWEIERMSARNLEKVWYVLSVIDNNGSVHTFSLYILYIRFIIYLLYKEELCW